MRTLVVSPTPGNPSASGTALLSAMAAITTASASNPYLIRIEPGVYDLGASSLVLKPYVDLEGSGEAVTKITGTGAAVYNSGTIVGSTVSPSTVELRFLTVANSGGNAYATAIFLNIGSPNLTHITATAAGGSAQNVAIFGLAFSAAELTDVIATASASGAATAYGVAFNGAATPRLTNVSAAASGGTFGYGAYFANGAYAVLVNVSATAVGATYNYATYFDNAWGTIRNSDLRGGPYEGVHVVNAPQPVTIEASHTTGMNVDTSTVKAGASLIQGVIQSSSNVSCADSYDDSGSSYQALLPGCQEH